jgi:hypothetical protein
LYRLAGYQKIRMTFQHVAEDGMIVASLCRIEAKPLVVLIVQCTLSMGEMGIQEGLQLLCSNMEQKTQGYVKAGLSRTA